MVRLVQSLIFVTLVALVAVRPLVTETFDYRTDSISLALADIGDPTPLLTLGFDAVILLCGLAWLITRAFDVPVPFRRTGLEWGAVLVAVAAVISCVYAGHKRVAITASLDWLCLPVLAITLTQLMRTRTHRRVLLIAVLASACVQSFHAFEQYFVGFEETWSAYQAGKAEFWANQGVRLDSNKVELFERRMQAREASGTFYHSNVAGSYLVLCGISALGLAIGAWRTRTKDDSALTLLAKIGCCVFTALIFASVWLTGSLGAIATGGAGIVALFLVWRYERWINVHRRRLFAAGWIVFLLGCIAVVGHGWYHGSLPGSSLNFRWQYWVNSTGMIADHPLTGVGRENFGNHYLAYKSIESPEEISNPHNLFVQAASEWGLLGFAGVMMMVWGVSRILTRTVRGSPEELEPLTHGIQSTPNFGSLGGYLSLLTVGLLVVIGRLAQSGSSQEAYLYYTGMVTALIWLAGALVFSKPTLADKNSEGATDLTHAGVSIGVLAFAIHELVNFAVFVPGSGTTLFALVALACVDTPDATSSARIGRTSRVRRMIAPIVGIVLASLVYSVAIGPPLKAHRVLDPDARISLKMELKSASHDTLQDVWEWAAKADPLEPHPYHHWLGALNWAATVPAMRREALELAETALASEIERNPYSASLHRKRMYFYRERAEDGHVDGDWQRAIESGTRSLELYPQNPQGMAELGDCLHAAGLATGNQTFLTRALKRYPEALALDNQRLAWEQLQRFPPRKTEEIREKIREVTQMLDSENE